MTILVTGGTDASRISMTCKLLCATRWRQMSPMRHRRDSKKCLSLTRKCSVFF